MFDYAKNMQLALTDTVRRTAIKAAAGVVIAIGAGFLIAALWTFLADTLDWGPLGASLAIGILFVVIGVIVMMMGKKVHHPVPSTDELRAEVETRVSLATDAALEKARIKAAEVVDSVENKVYGLVDDVSYKANKLADDAEAKVYSFTRTAAHSAANSVGLTPSVLSDAQESLSRAASSRFATIPPVIGAFAAGIAIASRLQAWRHQDDGFDDDLDDDEYDDYY